MFQSLNSSRYRDKSGQIRLQYLVLQRPSFIMCAMALYMHWSLAFTYCSSHINCKNPSYFPRADIQWWCGTYNVFQGKSHIHRLNRAHENTTHLPFLLWNRLVDNQTKHRVQWQTRVGLRGHPITIAWHSHLRFLKEQKMSKRHTNSKTNYGGTVDWEDLSAKSEFLSEHG